MDVENLEKWIVNAQIIIAIATAFYFMISYNNELEKLKSGGTSLKFLFFVVLFANSLAVGVDHVNALLNNEEPNLFAWLGVFTLTCFIAILHKSRQ
mgnify:CR=1 FL=1